MLIIMRLRYMCTEASEKTGLIDIDGSTCISGKTKEGL